MPKNRILIAFYAAVSVGTALASPLDQSKVAADAQWVLHLDMEAFRNTKLGGYLVKNVLQPKIDEAKQGKNLNLSLNLQNISGITAYGASLGKEQDGVLFLSTSADVKKDLDTLVGIASLSGSESKDVTMVQQSPYLLYSIKDQVFITPAEKGILVAKSKERIARGREILNGKGKNLSGSSTFSGYPKTEQTFFFLGMAEGLNESAQIPPQAQVLRETRGGRLVLGEKGENLFINLVFKGKDDESTLKIQQVLQGIVALLSLSQQDKDITDLASRTKIASTGRNVSVDLVIPTSTAIQKVEAKQENQAEKSDKEESSEVK